MFYIKATIALNFSGSLLRLLMPIIERVGGGCALRKINSQAFS